MSIVQVYTEAEYKLCKKKWDGLVCGHGVNHAGDNYCPICLNYSVIGG